MTNGNEALTLGVPEAGKRYFGLSRNASYDAAARGDIPVVRIGRLLRVPIRAVERMLDTAGQRLKGGVTNRLPVSSQRDQPGMGRA